MTPAENNLLLFLVKILHAELSDWEYLPSRGELRQQLDQLIEAKKTEELEAHKPKPIMTNLAGEILP